MNYLAHIALSGIDRQHRIGGFLGDFVRGPLRGDYPSTVEQGIRLHRRIDAYVDEQPELVNVLELFESPMRRYAGVVADIVFDHCLASDWSTYYDESLGVFCEQFYTQLVEFEHPLPDRAAYFASRAPKIGWLESYADLDNLDRILNAVGTRFRKPVPLHDAMRVIRPNLDRIRHDFHRLYPRLQSFAQASGSEFNLE